MTKRTSLIVFSDDGARERAACERAHAETLLDDALRETFPASDPIAVFIPSTQHRESP